MRTTNHDHKSIRRSDRERELAQFERAWVVRHQGNQVNIWCDIRVLVYQPEIGSRPGGAESHNFRRLTFVVALLWWQRRIFSVKGAWQVCTKNPKSFLRRIDDHFGIYPEHITEPSHVIPVSMRHNDEIQFGQIDSFCFRIVREDVRIVSGVEQNTVTSVFHESRVSPVFLHLRSFTKGIVEHGDLCLRWIDGSPHEGCAHAVSDQSQQSRTIRNTPRLSCHFLYLHFTEGNGIQRNLENFTKNRLPGAA